MVKIAPSILSANFTKLGEEIESVRSADYLHFDVMDGLFVPNISVGLPVLESVRAFTDMVLDVHLMIEKPVRYVERFAKAGADILVIHAEADEPENLQEALGIIRSLGKRAGLSLKPKTPAEVILPYLDMLSMVSVMGVEPGFGGQKFMADQLEKIARLRELIGTAGICCEIEVDGGINPETARACAKAGADVLVAGSDVFKAENRAKRIMDLRN